MKISPYPAVDTLLPGALHKPAAMTMVLCTGTFLALAAPVAGESRAGPIDRAVSALVRAAAPSAHELSRRLIPLGDAGPVIGAAIVLALVAFALGLRRAAVLAILGPLLTGLLTTGTKPLVGRTIRDHYAYPSGHTGAWTALGLVIALGLVGALAAGPVRSALIVAAGACCGGGTMALAIVRVGSHYPSDTVGGFCVAVVAVLGAALVLERLPRRRIPNGGD